MYAGLPPRDRAELAALRSALLTQLLAPPGPPVTAAARALHALARLGTGDETSAKALAGALRGDVEKLTASDAAGSLWALTKVSGGRVDYRPILR